MKRLSIASIIVTALLMAGGFRYNYWINTPQYSLLQIQKSFLEKDRLLFEKHVDTDKIIKELVEDLSNFSIEEMDAEESSENFFFNPKVFASGISFLLKPLIENFIAKIFDDLWEDKVEAIENRITKLDLKNLESFRMSYLNRVGKIAELGLEMADPDSGEVLKVKFKLKKIDNYWRVTQISVEELLRQYKDETEELIGSIIAP
jgi:hypothetical protein